MFHCLFCPVLYFRRLNSIEGYIVKQMYFKLFKHKVGFKSISQFKFSKNLDFLVKKQNKKFYFLIFNRLAT